MESFELVSDADYPLIISNILITIYRRQSDGSLTEYQSVGYSSPDFFTTEPLWTLSDGDSEEGKFTLIHRCVLGNLNWCAPTNEGWFYKDMTMDSIGDLVRSSITRTLPSSDYVDLNFLFADVINDQGFGCPNTDHLECGPLKFNAFCSGKGGRTHCIDSTGQCVSQDDASGHSSTFGSNDIDSSCRYKAPPSLSEVTGVAWDNEDTLPFPYNGFGISRPIKTDYCSTADVAVPIVDGVWQYPEVGQMYKTSLARKPLNYIPTGWISRPHNWAPDPTKLIDARAMCPPGFASVGALITLLGDWNGTPGAIERHCCVPSTSLVAVSADQFWDFTHPFSTNDWRYDPATGRVVYPNKMTPDNEVNVFTS